MTDLRQKKSQRRKTCSSSLHFPVDTQSKESFCKDICVLKDLCEQAKYSCMFYTEDRYSLEHCLREKDVSPTLEERKYLKEIYLKFNTAN